MSTPAPTTIDLGGCRVQLLQAGRFRLDGGAMFGIIPKPLWSRLTPADEQNRITLGCNCLLVDWPGSDRRVLIEAGHGDKYTGKEPQIFAFEPESALLPELARHGIDPATITDVVLTHLHFDHAGGLTYLEGDRPVPTLPHARVHVSRQEYDDATRAVAVMRTTYRAENLDPLTAAGAWELHAEAGEILPGITTWPTPGHTRGHSSIILAGRRPLVFAGDVLPTRHHIGAPYNMAYDLFPLENRAAKGALLRWVVEHDALLALGHDPDHAFFTVTPRDDWFALTPDRG